MVTRKLTYIAVYNSFMSRHHCPLDVGSDRGCSTAVARVNFSGEQGPEQLLDIYWTFRGWGDYEPAPGMIITRSLRRQHHGLLMAKQPNDTQRSTHESSGVLLPDANSGTDGNAETRSQDLQPPSRVISAPFSIALAWIPQGRFRMWGASLAAARRRKPGSLVDSDRYRLLRNISSSGCGLR